LPATSCCLVGLVSHPLIAALTSCLLATTVLAMIPLCIRASLAAYCPGPFAVASCSPCRPLAAPDIFFLLYHCERYCHMFALYVACIQYCRSSPRTEPQEGRGGGSDPSNF
jgi:hypothetical protein